MEAPVMNRRQTAKAATSAKVLAAAKGLFEAVGYEQASIRDIARAAGMSTGAVFANYKDKAALYVAAFGHPPVTPEAARSLINQASLAITEVHKAFGAPGNYGYETAKGAALYALYRALLPMAEAVPIQGDA